jgi:hypothetical protein
MKENEDDRMLPFVFDLDVSKLIYISSKSDLVCLMNSLEYAQVVGLDTETKPAMTPFQTELYKTSLLQLAVRGSDAVETVFIIDLLDFATKIRKLEELDSILEIAFRDTQVLKLGQGFENDIQHLRKSYPYMKCFEVVNSCLEVCSLVSHLSPEIKQRVALRKIVRDYLHLDLQKSQQLSDWSQRPLSESQIHYAACDALVLLRLFDTLKWEIEDTCRGNRMMTTATKVMQMHIFYVRGGNNKRKHDKDDSFGEEGDSKRTKPYLKGPQSAPRSCDSTSPLSVTILES